MAITRVGTATASATTVTVPAHQAGDIIVIWAMHGGATTIPALPAGWNSAFTKTESTSVALGTRCGYKIATTTNDASGTWTNASELICAVYRPSAGNTIRVGQSASSSSTTDTINYPALSPMADGTSGASWVLGLVAASNLTQVLTTAFTGMTSVTSIQGTTYQSALADTNAGVSSWSSTNQTVTGTAGKSVSGTVELVLATKTDGLASNVYQHVKGGGNPPDPGGTPLPGNGFICRMPLISGSGNTIDFSFTCDAGATISSVTGSVNGAYTQGKAASGGTGNLDSYKYYVQNVTAGSAPEWVTVTFSANVNAFCWESTELYGVATSGGLAGTTSSAFSTSKAAGSFTPTNNDGTGGNIILAYHSKADTGPAGITTRLFPSLAGGTFTLLGADIGWINANDSMTHLAQGYLQATHAAINPTPVSVAPDSNADHWNSLAVAYKVSAGSGTAPGGNPQIQTRHSFSTLHFPASGNFVLQVPCKGNCRVICSDDPNLHTQTVTDSEGNVWTTTAATAGFWFAPNTSSNPNLEIYLTGGGTDTKVSWRAADCMNTAASPYDSFVVSGQNVDSVTSFTMSPAPTPLVGNTLTIANIGLGQGPGIALTAPSTGFFDLTTYTGEADTDDIENADLMGHYYASASGAQTWTWTITSVGTNSTSGGALTLIGASSGVTVALTGQKATFSPGTLGVTHTKALTGIAITSTAGNLGGTEAEALVGQKATFKAGTMLPSVSVALTGQRATFTAGTMTASGNVTIALTGQRASFTAGTLKPGNAVALTGKSASMAAGHLVPSTTVTLNGKRATFSPGTLSVPGVTVGIPAGKKFFVDAGTLVNIG